MRAMFQSRVCLFLLAVLPLLAASRAESAEAIVSTMRNPNAVMQARGFYLAPAPEQTGEVPPGDHAPVLSVEIIRPNGEAIGIGRLYTSCTCVRLEAPQRSFQQGERAILKFRNVLATPQQGQNYAMYVQLTSPIRTTLRYDTFVQSQEFRPPEPAKAPEPAKTAESAKSAESAKKDEAEKKDDAAKTAKPAEGAGSVKIPTPPEESEIEVGGKKMILLTPKADKAMEKKDEKAGEKTEAKAEEKAGAKAEEKKIEEEIAEQKKIEESVGEKQKADEEKSDEIKAEEQKAEEKKLEAAKAKEQQAEEQQIEEAKAEDRRIEEQKAEEKASQEKAAESAGNEQEESAETIGDGAGYPHERQIENPIEGRTEDNIDALTDPGDMLEKK